MKNHQIIFSGSGGQGVMFIGKMLAKLAVDVYPHVAFFPSYGAEVRGGTSHCHVRLSQDPIATPMVERATVLVLANQPSVDRFLPMLAADGAAFVNSSLAKAEDDNVIHVGATQLAMELGDVQAANIVLFGAMLQHAAVIGYQRALDEVLKASARKGERAAQINRQAFEKGWALAGQYCGTAHHDTPCQHA
jgi:2-oxoglutarate ferredoxin oxidoreductase subunit gamma